MTFSISCSRSCKTLPNVVSKAGSCVVIDVIAGVAVEMVAEVVAGVVATVEVFEDLSSLAVSFSLREKWLASSCRLMIVERSNFSL